eukprot:scaffold23886_cov16-Tisochrysis_lutea.AAC.1
MPEDGEHKRQQERNACKRARRLEGVVPGMAVAVADLISIDSEAAKQWACTTDLEKAPAFLSLHLGQRVLGSMLQDSSPSLATKRWP